MLYPPNIVHLHPPSLQISHTCALRPRGTKVVRGSQCGEGSMRYVILGFRVPTTSYSSNLPHLYPPTKGGSKGGGAQVAKGSGGMLYYVLGCPPPLPPTFVPSHQCTLQTLFSYILPPFKVPAFVPSHQDGGGSEEEQWWWEEWGGRYVILCFRVPTTSDFHICALPPMYPADIVHLHPPSLCSQLAPWTNRDTLTPSSLYVVIEVFFVTGGGDPKT